MKTADGVVRGSYSYVDANNIVQTVNYISDDFGFRVAATNLPVGPTPVEVKSVPLPAIQPPVESVAPAVDHTLDIRSGDPFVQ
jgi:hypothetical protein